MPPSWPIPRIPGLRRPGTDPARTPPPDPAGEREAELIRALEAVTALCNRVVDALDADRAERAALVAALGRIADVVDAGRVDSRDDRPAVEVTERILGGTIGPVTSATDPERNGTLPPSVDAEPPAAVEVRSGLEDRWVDGFEVCETVNDDQGIRYRIRRLVDRVVLPDLFTEHDVRRRATGDPESAAPRTRRWSPF